jgi:hypothetical protein
MRLNVDLSDSQARLLDSLMEMSGAKTKTELVINAVLFLSWGLNTVYRGKDVAALDSKNDAVERLQMPLFQHAAAMGEADRVKEKAVEAAAAD